MELRLNKRERKLIKKIIAYQIENLTGIISNDMQEYDLETYCLSEELDKKLFIDIISKDIDIYHEAYNKPNDMLLTLNDKHISTLTHILWSYFKHKKYANARSSIWRKINLFNNFYFNYN